MIAYYAHEDGDQHSIFAQLFQEAMTPKVKIYTSSKYYFKETSNVKILPSEKMKDSSFHFKLFPVPKHLHYSPVSHRPILDRSSQFLRSLHQNKVSFVVVDVSVEIASLLRAASIPYVYVKLPGNRLDLPHLTAMEASIFNIAYYPRAFESSDTPRWLVNKTLYLGYISNVKQNKRNNNNEGLSNITIVLDKGVNDRLEKNLLEIIKCKPNVSFTILGSPNSDIEYSNVFINENVENILPYLETANLIITSCELSLISQLLGMNSNVCAIPEEKPYDEQVKTFENLYKSNLILGIDDLLSLSDEDLVEKISQLERLNIPLNNFAFLNRVLENTNFDPLQAAQVIKL